MVSYAFSTSYSSMANTQYRQATVLKSGLAADQIWQFGPNGTAVNPSYLSDVNTIYYGSAEYATLGTGHAKAMLKKKV
jgi:mannan endo-1,4-beta-mannosidase